MGFEVIRLTYRQVVDEAGTTSLTRSGRLIGLEMARFIAYARGKRHTGA